MLLVALLPLAKIAVAVALVRVVWWAFADVILDRVGLPFI